jgi:hypothetical protein
MWARYFNKRKDCLTNHSFYFQCEHEPKTSELVYDKGRVLNKSIFDLQTNKVIAHANTQITPKLIEKCKEKQIREFYIRSPLTCNLYRAICQKCYGWDL